MEEVVSAKLFNNIYKEIIEKNKYTIHGEIEGLNAGLEEMFDHLITWKKEIQKAKKRFRLDTLIFDSDISSDVKLFFEYIGYFNEGGMKMIVYVQGKEFMLIKSIDGDEISLERCDIND